MGVRKSLVAVAVVLAGCASNGPEPPSEQAAQLEALAGADGSVPSSRPSSAVVTVTAFGATGDGRSDDGPALRAAIAALPGEGGSVVFPPGTYAIGTSGGAAGTFPDGGPIASGVVVDRDDVVLRGSGRSSVLRLLPGRKMRIMTVTGDDVVVERLVFDGNKAARDGSRPWPDADVVDGLLVGWTADRLVVRACEARDGIEDGIGVWQSDGVRIERCLVHGNGTAEAGGAGIAVSSSSGIVAQNVVRDNTAAGITSTYDSQSVSIAGNLVQDNWKEGIVVDADDFVVRGNEVTGNGRSRYGALSVVGASRGLITGNRVVDNYFVAIDVGDAEPVSTSVLITGNTCSDTPSSPRQGIGVRVGRHASRVEVRDNTCTGNGSGLASQIVVAPGAGVNADWPEANTRSA